MSCLKRFGIAALALALTGVPLPASQAQEAGSSTRAPEVEAARQRGDELLAAGNFSDAVDAYNEALLNNADYIEALVGKGKALKGMQDFRGAIAAFGQAFNLDNNLPEALNGQGEAYMELSPPQYDLALTVFGYALGMERRNSQFLSNFGHVVVALGQDPMTALARLDEALAINPNDARAYRDRGMAHAQLREFDKAILDLQKASEVEPGDFENYSTLALIYQIKEEYASAVIAMTNAIDNYKPKKMTDSDEYVVGYLTRADLRLKLAETERDPAVRQEVLEQVVADAQAVLAASEPKTVEAGQALYRQGRAERMLERYSAAVDSLTGAIQIGAFASDIDYLSSALLYRGICWYNIGSLDLARGDFEQSASIGSGFGDPRISLWIGITYHRQGDFRLAIDAYSEAIAKAPNFSLAHINKGRAYMDLGEYKKAIQSFNDAIRSEPDVGDHYYNVGLAYIQLDEFQKAVDFLNLALRQDNPQPKMYQKMAVALRGIGRDDLAPEYERRAEEVKAADN